MKVKLIIKDGKVTLETSEVRGKKCVDVADELAKLLGTKTDQRLKPQYYDENEVVQQRNS